MPPYNIAFHDLIHFQPALSVGLYSRPEHLVQYTPSTKSELSQRICEKELDLKIIPTPLGTLLGGTLIARD